MSVHSTAASDLEAPAETLMGLPGGLIQRARRAAAVAAAHAEAVDEEARFPAEALLALRREKLLAIQVPSELGGEGSSICDVAEVCYILGGACSSSAMIFAMHHIKLACLVRHARASDWQDRFLGRVAAGQLLLASSTTEGQSGGDVRACEAAVVETAGRIVLERDASVISYGAEADAVVTTARRNTGAVASDQVLVVFERADYSLTATQAWETLGMRGTRSLGFSLKAEGGAGQIVPVSYETIHAETMSPVAHLLWSAVWAGIASAAVERARLHTRRAARKSAGAAPYGLPHFVEAVSSLKRLRALLLDALIRFEGAKDASEVLQSLEFQTAAALLKVETSELAVGAVMSAFRAGGLAAYRSRGDASMGRHLRDVLSAPIMISNERILGNVALSTLLVQTPASLGTTDLRTGGAKETL